MDSILKVVKGVVFVGLLLVLGVIWFGTCFRWTAVFFAGGCILVLPFLSAQRRPRAVRVLWIGVLVLSLLPADVSFRSRPGAPRLVRVVRGNPDRALVERAQREELILEGGCLAVGYQPVWVLVW